MPQLVPLTIHFDNQTIRQLNTAAKHQDEQVEILIGRAVNEWLERNILSLWPREVQSFKGMADIPLFEACRDKLAAPLEDPLA